ncbi:helix-turn-helix domain-containing protein [Myxococcus sp. K15C18031901]|uniref:helix-turn-helix domain-containing protein n=1 Tax=Myxococcus dinghuensis TaxID=2906761 RepID=UPI0020A7D412|nr:helix-turn-helix domain-containing protein [Myxococcus dinghuensis]MCP3104950.1 helix-turn-helix domain-containing protein [Myxococcus dinghuensis]
MSRHENEPVALPPEKLRMAQDIRQRLESVADRRGARRKSPLLALMLPDGGRLELPEETAVLLRDLFAALAEGEAVSIVPMHRELSTQEAADLLNISRQGLVNLLEAKKLPFFKHNKHRRILARDLLRYKRQRDEERAGALRELTQLSEESGDYFGGS